MSIQEEIENAKENNKLFLIIFYADWSPHYEWVNRAMAEEEPNVKVFRVNIEGDKKIAETYNIDIVPAFVLMKGITVLWRQTGEVIPDELKDIIIMFNS